jgi:hypothetical protein
MESSKLALQLGILLISVLALVCFCRLFEDQINEMLTRFFALLLQPFYMLRDFLHRFWLGVGKFYRDQFSVDGKLDLQHVFFRFIGSLLYSIFFFGFNFSEFHLLALTMSAAGIEAGHFNSPIGAGTLTALALLASFLFWGSIILDLSGATNTAPWRDRLNEKWKKYLLGVALTSLALSLFVAGSMGFFRGKVIADESLNPQSYLFPYEGGLSDSSAGIFQSNTPVIEQNSNENPHDLYYWIPIIANVCIPVLVGIGGVFAGWGIVIFLKFLILMIGFSIICPSGLVLLVSHLFINTAGVFYNFIFATFRLFTAMGGRFMEIFGWNPAESNQPEDSGIDVSSERENRIDNQSEDRESPGESNNDDQPAPPEDGWDPFTVKEE